MSAGLPELIGQAGAELVRLCEVTEAQLLVVGWNPPGRLSLGSFAGAADPADFDGADEARAELLAAGLAAPGTGLTPAATVAPAGRLAAYLELVTGHRRQTSTWASWLQAERPPAHRTLLRITGLDWPGAQVAAVERMRLPVPNEPHAALPIAIDLIAHERLVDELVALAYREPDSRSERDAAPGTESVLLGPDRRLAAVPARLVHAWDAPVAVLHWRVNTLLGRRAQGEWVGRRPATFPRVRAKQYRDHLDRRLTRPERS